ncbi:MAG: RagB/SusD family nutrient uptake outer membrane protein [Niastella sp.]|nr:RagB/SusD family nutrient uptake outer membrane protein [Niastella sp.]
MKKILFPLLISGALVVTGCNKWLDVKPEGQTTKDEMFQTQKGFRDALTGAYLNLKSGDAYGGAMTWSTIEFLARNWDVVSPNYTDLNNLVNGNYADASVKAMIEKIYAKEYKVVADVNSILEKIEGKKTIFLDQNYTLIKGESLALRAFAHFDILRMFGTMPDNPGNELILPYVTEVSKAIVPLTTYDNFAKQVLTDLDQAEALLKDVDPITQYSLLELNPVLNSAAVPPVSDDYYMYRQIRMNYYAVLALKARVYNWLIPRDANNRANAIKYAQMVINAKDRTGKPTFRLGELSDAQLGNPTFPSEHVAAIDVYNLKTAAENNLGEPGRLAKTDFNIQDGYYYLNNLFPVAERATDARWVGMWSYKTTAGQTGYVKLKKFTQKEVDPTNQIPLIRLSEMYLILTETAQSKADAESYYSFYCNKKGIPFVNGFATANWETDRRNKMIREYVREFYAEGQTFFTYKRYNMTSLPAGWNASGFSGTTARYIVPKPDREISYHNK